MRVYNQTMEILGYLIYSAISSVFSFILIGIIWETFQERALSKNDELCAKGLALLLGVMSFWYLIDQ
tara:strand:+ start:289 stop:489 length:201 start_codon:yes stop_codon:yes gene_type:complete